MNFVMSNKCSKKLVFHTAAVYTYYTSLCQDESLRRKGTYAKRKVQRRRRERVVRVRTLYVHLLWFLFISVLSFNWQRRLERESQFKRMSYSDVDREKWQKVLVTQLMSSDESGTDEEQPAFIVKELQWRSDKVTSFFEKLDRAHTTRKTEQATRQTKRRVRKGVSSERPAPSDFPTWAVLQ